MNTKLIYYFSGTGNSLYAATKIAKQIKPAKIISMRCDPRDFPANDADVIGFVFPVYHWSLPGFAKAFIESFVFQRIAIPAGFAVESVRLKIFTWKTALLLFNIIAPSAWPASFFARNRR